MRTDLTEAELIELRTALQKERDKFNEKGMDIKDHCEALTYISTGAVRGDQEENDLLYAAINDTRTLYNDYCKTS